MRLVGQTSSETLVGGTEGEEGNRDTKRDFLEMFLQTSPFFASPLRTATGPYLSGDYTPTHQQRSRRKYRNHHQEQSLFFSTAYVAPWAMLLRLLPNNLQVATLDSKLSQALPTEITQKSRKLEQLEREAAEPQRSREVRFRTSDVAMYQLCCIAPFCERLW